MIRHQTSVHLDCPVPQVFAFLADPANLIRWQSNLVKTEPLSAGPLRTGSRFREVRRLGSKESEIQGEVSAFEPDRRLATRTLTPPEVTVSYIFSPEDNGTRLRYEFAMRTSGLMRLMEPLILGSVRKDSASDLLQLKRLLEA
jgi:uncharacterized protein YndB with AHSA1/START domain